MRRNGLLLGLAALLALLGITVASAAGPTVVTDKRADKKALKRKPELDIRKASAANQGPNRVKHKITMQGKLKPGKKFTRPFLLINTRGGGSSDYEYLVLGPRVFKKIKKKFRKVGANSFSARRKTWTYSFKPSRLGLDPGEKYGWAVLTAKGNAVDLAPNKKYSTHRVSRAPEPEPAG